MRYGYARVSTKKQLIGGNGLEAQITLLKSAGCEKIIAEEYTGKSSKRPRLGELLFEIKRGDILTVTKLDRLARSLFDGAKLINELFERGIAIHVLDMGLLDNTPTGRLIINIFLSVAEFERSMILERTALGLEVARTKEGFRIGRRPIDAQKKKDAADLVIFNNRTHKEVANLTGLSPATLTRAIRARRDELAVEKMKNL